MEENQLIFDQHKKFTEKGYFYLIFMLIFKLYTGNIEKLSRKFFEGENDIKKQDQSNKELWQSLATYGFSSLNLGITILGGYYIGSLLEKNYHWSNMSIFGILVGLALGLVEIFIIAFKVGAKK